MPKKAPQLCQLPSPGSITGRASSITNAFFNAILPVHEPTREEVLEALRILAMDPDDIRCAYCGDRSTEWDHLRPLITNQLPTGYITEIANLMPACGKCNQSKGKRDWREWMISSSPLSPATRGIKDIDDRIRRIEQFTEWRTPLHFDFLSLVEPEAWQQHLSNWKSVLELLKQSQILAKDIRTTISQATRQGSTVTPAR